MIQVHSAITIGLAGKYILSSPFNLLINNQLSYTCVAIEYIANLHLKGSDPFNNIYFPVGLTKERFDSDYSQNIPIYTLQSSKGDILMIPGLNVTSLPDVNGVNYSNVLLGVSLSALPDDFDLSSVKSEISDLVFNKIGVRSEVKSIIFGTSSVITQEQHIALESARKQHIINNKSNLSKLIDLESQNVALLERVKLLEQHIANL